MNSEATHHDFSSFVAGAAVDAGRSAARPGSEIIQLPDHDPELVENAIDVAEKAVDEGLHGVLSLQGVIHAATIARQCCSRFSRR
jgi:hypothetical protein